MKINYFKLSRFNDNETGQQIRKIGIKGTSEKKHLFSYQFKNFFSPEKKKSCFKQINYRYLTVQSHLNKNILGTFWRII